MIGRIINGSDPSQIIARAPQPLWSPQRQPWMEGNPQCFCPHFSVHISCVRVRIRETRFETSRHAGKDPYTCNVVNVAFLEVSLC